MNADWNPKESWTPPHHLSARRAFFEKGRCSIAVRTARRGFHKGRICASNVLWPLPEAQKTFGLQLSTTRRSNPLWHIHSGGCQLRKGGRLGWFECATAKYRASQVSFRALGVFLNYVRMSYAICDKLGGD